MQARDIEGLPCDPHEISLKSAAALRDMPPVDGIVQLTQVGCFVIENESSNIRRQRGHFLTGMQRVTCEVVFSLDGTEETTPIDDG
jgi:hypothetical protein